MEDLPKILARRIYQTFLVNYFASKHPDYSHLYSSEIKDFLAETFCNIRSLDLSAKPVYWSAKELFEHAAKEKMVGCLLFTPVEEQFRDIVLPTWWYHRDIIQEILEKYE